MVDVEGSQVSANSLRENAIETIHTTSRRTKKRKTEAQTLISITSDSEISHDSDSDDCNDQNNTGHSYAEPSLQPAQSNTQDPVLVVPRSVLVVQEKKNPLYFMGAFPILFPWGLGVPNQTCSRCTSRTSPS